MKIRTKLLYGYSLLFILFCVLIGFAHYSQATLGKNIDRLGAIASEIDETQDIGLAFEKLLMPPNDYLISADLQERDRYNEFLEQLLSMLEIYDNDNHKEIKKDLKLILVEIDKYAHSIFSISPEKIQSRDHSGVGLMYAMDKVGREGIMILVKHAEEDRIILAEIMRESDRTRHKMATLPVIFGLGVLFTGLALIFFFDRSIRAPVEKLTTGVRGVSHGRWNQVEIGEHGELTELAYEFNKMVDQVSENYEELEMKVEERTKMLDALNRKLKKQAITDGLTELYNHRYFYDKLEEELARAARYQREVVVLMADIDYFKVYNDKFGHLAGDKVLKGVANVIKNQCRKGDTVARYGGEEFSVIAPELPSSDAFEFANRIRKAVIDVDFKGETKLPDGNVTISIGVAFFPRDGKTSKELLENADVALYEAKKTGRNKAVLFKKKKVQKARY